MKRIVKLAILPLLGILIVSLGLFWSHSELWLRIRGVEQNGKIAGMILQRSHTADILTGIETCLTITQAKGAKIEAKFRNFEFFSATYIEPNGSESIDLEPIDVQAGENSSTKILSKELQKVIQDSVQGDASNIRWALLRESRRSTDTSRVIRIQKTEIVHGYFDISKVPELLRINSGVLNIDAIPTAESASDRVEITAVFDSSNPDKVHIDKGETLTQYDYKRNGITIVPDKRDFYLWAEPYSTEFRPVFSFKSGDQELARMSHIGRHGGPTLALRLFGNCKVYSDPAEPGSAVLIADPGSAKNGRLQWFSRFCEGLFGQWGTAALMLLSGIIFIGAGLMILSLAIWPRRDIDCAPSRTP